MPNRIKNVLSDRNLLRMPTFAVLALLTAAMAPQALRAQNSLGCSKSTLMGGYRALANGTVAGTGPKAQLNNLYLDGNGNGLVTEATSSTNGTIALPTPSTPSTFTYTVNSDCTGTYVSGASIFNIVVDKQGGRFFFVRANGGTVVVPGQAIRFA